MDSRPCTSRPERVLLLVVVVLVVEEEEEEWGRERKLPLTREGEEKMSKSVRSKVSVWRVVAACSIRLRSWEVVRKEVAGLMTLNLRTSSKVFSSKKGRPGSGVAVDTAAAVVVIVVVVAAAAGRRPKAKLCSPPATTMNTRAFCKPRTSVARQEEEEWREESAVAAEAPIPSCPLLLAPIDQTCPLLVNTSV